MSELLTLDYKKIIASSEVYQVTEGEHRLGLTRKDLNEITKLLMSKSLFTVDEVLSLGYGATMRRSYILNVHPALLDDIIGAVGFISIKLYPRRESALPNEIGSVGHFRVIIDSSLEDYVVNGENHQDGDRSRDSYISIAYGFSDDKFNPNDYIVVRSS